MLPIFPKFEFLEYHHKEKIKKITDKYLPYSDYNFVSLWSYDTKKNIQVSNLNDNLVIKFTDYIDTKSFYSFFGNKKFNDTVLDLLKFSRSKNIVTGLKLIPELFIKEQKYISKKIIIKEDRDNFDYVYSLKKLNSLSGGDLERKRRSFNKFTRETKKFSVQLLDLNNKTTKKEIIELFHTWCKIKGKKVSETENEMIAISKLIKESHFFEFISTGILIDRKLIAFSINEKLHDGFSIGHFSKTDPSYEGINEALYKYTAEELIKAGCQYLNLEQDMGHEGLRKSKLLWRPVHFLKKYTIEPK